MFLTSSLGISIAESMAYAGGPQMATSSWLVTAVNVVVFSFILTVDTRGFKAGKWVFTRLHPRYRTPTRALWFVVLCCFSLATLGLIGVARQEAFQLAITAAQACYGLYYLILFAIPLASRTKLSPPSGVVVRVSALSGLAVTLLAVILQVVPIIDVQPPWVFAGKVTAALIGANLLGVFIYRRAQAIRRI